jgi:hypothetical protein
MFLIKAFLNLECRSPRWCEQEAADKHLGQLGHVLDGLDRNDRLFATGVEQIVVKQSDSLVRRRDDGGRLFAIEISHVEAAPFLGQAEAGVAAGGHQLGVNSGTEHLQQTTAAVGRHVRWQNVVQQLCSLRQTGRKCVGQMM